MVFRKPTLFHRKSSKATYYRIPELESFTEPLYEEWETLEQEVEHRWVAYRSLWQQWKSRTQIGFRRISWPRWDWKAWVHRQMQWKRQRVDALLKQRAVHQEKAVQAFQSIGHLFKRTLVAGLRMGAASVGLFVVGFFVMNAPAYTDLIKTSLLEWSGAPQDTSLEEHFVQEEAIEQELLAFTSSPEEQREQVGTLNLDITPPDNRLIIPSLNKNIPIVESDPSKLVSADWKSLEKTFQEDLQNGVLHYPGTANPGEVGNAFITGHSSYYLWDPGRYKNVFARLNQVEVGDDVIVYYNQEKFHYRIIEKKEVKNDDVSVLSQTDQSLLTLMTCSPVGTNIRRLVVVAELVEE